MGLFNGPIERGVTAGVKSGLDVVFGEGGPFSQMMGKALKPFADTITIQAKALRFYANGGQDDGAVAKQAFRDIEAIRQKAIEDTEARR